MANFIDQKFDFIIPLGSHCIPAHILKELGVRKNSFPFDWLFTQEKDFFSTAVNCIIEKFSNFLLKKSVEQVDIYANKGFIACIDKYTKFIFVHDFTSCNKPLSDYLSIKRKYKRRERRLIKILSKKADILFVYFDETNISDDVFVSKLNELSKKYKRACFSLLICQNTPTFGEFEVEEEIINKNILKVKFNNSEEFAPSKEESWLHNYKISKTILEKYCKLKQKAQNPFFAWVKKLFA